MNTKLKTWLPAILFIAAAVVLIVIYVVMPEQRERGMRPREGDLGGLFSTLGTIAIYVGAGGFSWLWFKRKQKSPSMLIRKARALFDALHKPLGWITILLVAVHGIYFLFTKLSDHNIYSGLAAFAILAAIVGYGVFINKVRNKWMRTVHRTLGLIWVPVIWLHAGGSAIIAVIAVLAVGGAVVMLEKRAREEEQPAN